MSIPANMLKHLIHRLARPSLDDPDPGRRRRAVLRLDPVVERQRLTQCARTDADPAVRRACVARMQSAEDLLALCDDDDLQAFTYTRLRQLIENGQLDPLAIARQLPAQQVRRHLLQVVQLPEHWQPLLADLDSERLLSELSVQHGAAAVRLAAAQRVRSEGALRRIERGARDRDKAVAQLMRERLEALRQVRQTLQQLDDESDRLLTELRQLTGNVDDPLARQRLTRLEDRYATMLKERAALAPQLAGFGLDLPPAPGSTTEFAQVRPELTSALARLEAEKAATEAAAAAEAEQRRDQEAVIQSMEALWAQMAQRLQDHSAPASELTSLRAAVGLEQQRWTAISQQPAPHPELLERQQRVADRLQQLVDALNQLDGLPQLPEPATLESADAARQLLTSLEQQLTALNWPDAIPTPAAVRELQDALPGLQARVHSLEGAARQQSKAARATLKQLEQVLAGGRLRGTERLLEKARREVEDCDDPALQARLARAAARLGELQDWQQFATDNKREPLLEAMQALAADSSPADPVLRVEQVKGLRQQWIGLGPVTAAERELQQTFDAAAEAAFAPARAHFEAQAARQADNARVQERICAELETFLRDYDWSQADWPAVTRIYQRAREEWRQYQDTAGDAHQGPRFHALMRELRGQLAPRWKASIAQKRELIEAASGLTEHADPATEVRRLQQAWHQVGITPAGEDRKLRRAFQNACQTALERARTLQRQGAETTSAAGEQSAPMGALQLALLELQESRDRETDP